MIGASRERGRFGGPGLESNQQTVPLSDPPGRPRLNRQPTANRRSVTAFGEVS